MTVSQLVRELCKMPDEAQVGLLHRVSYHSGVGVSTYPASNIRVELFQTNKVLIIGESINPPEVEPCQK